MVNVFLKHENVTKKTIVGMEVMKKNAVMFELMIFYFVFKEDIILH